MSDKKPNHLASLMERSQMTTDSLLPISLQSSYETYQKATLNIKAALAEYLPKEILDDCWVVGLSETQITLSVTSVTAANHMRYLQKPLLQQIRAAHSSFRDLESLKIAVVNPLKSLQNYQQSPTCSIKKNRLSDKTKRNITQTANLVILDDKIKSALLKLAKEE